MKTLKQTNKILFLSLLLIWQWGMGLDSPAQETSAKDALSTLQSSQHLKSGERIVGLVGFFGQPLPTQWLVLTQLSESPGLYREFVVARGNIPAQRVFSRLKGQDLPEIPLKLSSIKVDAGAAFQAAAGAANAQQVRFESAHYQLRCREAGQEPVWMLNLLNTAQVSIGTIYVSATSGQVLRAAWLVPGESSPSGSLTAIP